MIFKNHTEVSYMIDYKKENINRITDYISSGIKKEGTQKIGIECEHFITNADCSPVSFYGEKGVEKILELLRELYPDATFSDGHLVGLNDGKVYITLEPAAQIEVSIIPFDDINKIKDLYLLFVKRIKKILDTFGYQLHTVGYHPGAEADDLCLIPKERYRLMDSYFKSIGNTPQYMMRGSASVQVNIDYFSEDDFAQKFRLANLLTPMFYLITDNAKTFEKNNFEGFSARSFAWENVDSSRCGALDFKFFRQYAAWIYSGCPVFIQQNNKDIACYNKTNENIFDSKLLTEDEIKHILSMVFPDVRVKQFIEIRAGDSMPPDYMFAYAALIKGLFYNKSAVEKINNMFFYVSEFDIRQQIKTIRCNGFDCQYFCTDFYKVIEKVFSLAEENLSSEEKQLMQPLKKSALSLKTPKQLLNVEVKA